jgi:uncharacterized protein YjbJ (UPF0337 family)
MYAGLPRVFPLACDVRRSSQLMCCGRAKRQERTNHEEDSMNWDQLEGKWKQYSGKVKEKWGKLNDDDLEVVRGRRDQLVGKIQERYGIVKQEAEKQVDEFARSFRSEDSTQAAQQGGPSEGTHSSSKEKKRGAGRS